MSTFIGPVTNSIIDGLVKEFKKKETKEKLMKNICDPFLHDVAMRYYPYFIVTMIILLVIIVLLISILIIVLCNGHKTNIIELSEHFSNKI